MKKKKWNRLFSVLFVMVTVISLLSGCGRKSAEKEDAETITVYLWSTQLYEKYAPYIQKQLPDINIEFVVGNNDLDFYRFLNENGGLPDIITCCRFSLHDASPLKDSLMDLSTTNAAGAVYDTYLNSFRNQDGSVNWLPVCADAHGFVVNKDLFEKYDIPLPTDYESFVSACQAFDEVGIRGFTADYYYDYTCMETLQGLSASELSSVDGRKWRTIYSDPDNAKREGLDSTVWPEAFERMEQFIQDTGLSQDDLDMNYDDIVEFMTALDDHMVSGLNDKELQRIGKYSLKDAEIIKKRCEDLGINIYCYESEGYPDRLKRIANPPAVLYTYGNLDFLNDKCVISVVGSREPSEYSVKITKHICADLIRRNCLLASGFAGGIDQIANRVAIENNSRPIAVCGTALDCDYPKGSNELKKQIAENGVIISEYFPGYKPFGNAFVNRNRILTGLSNAVLFTECSKESHGLDNVNHAISQGKQVFVVPPHDIYDSRYFGQRDLIRNECQPVFGAEDIVYSLGNERYQSLRLVESLGEFTLPAEDSAILNNGEPKTVKHRKSKRKVPDSKTVSETDVVKTIPEPDLSGLDDTQKSICKLLKSGNMLVDEIAAKLGMDISDVLAQLTELELYGTVKSYPGKIFGL